jgi:hypothetical protein
MPNLTVQKVSFNNPARSAGRKQPFAANHATPEPSVLSRQLADLLDHRADYLNKVVTFSRRDQEVKFRLFEALEDTAKLPLIKLMSIGADTPIWETVFSLKEIESTLGFSSLFARAYLNRIRWVLFEAGKAADREGLSKIMGDIDPPLRKILTRLQALPFVRALDNNCSGHPQKDGYLSFHLRQDSRQSIEQASLFYALVNEIEVPDRGTGKISHFDLPPQKLCRSIISARTKKTPPEWKNKNHSQIRKQGGDPECFQPPPTVPELIQLWQKFGWAISQFDHAPEEALIAEMFEPGESGGFGYAGGKFTRDFYTGIIAQLLETDPNLAVRHYSQIAKELKISLPDHK